jgi:hypothetical protein
MPPPSESGDNRSDVGVRQRHDDVAAGRPQASACLARKVLLAASVLTVTNTGRAPMRQRTQQGTAAAGSLSGSRANVAATQAGQHGRILTVTRISTLYVRALVSPTLHGHFAG